MNELLTENRRLHSQIEKLTDENMTLAAVIRTLRQHRRKDNAKLEEVQREVWLWKNGKYQLDCVAVEGCKSAGEVQG
jgi:predicted RNase H-like nuclease (RuvC/YqgF family)